MLHRNLRSFLVVSFVALIAAMGLLVSPKPASATSGSIPEFSVDSQLHVHIRVTCPGSVGFNWQVGVDNWGQIHQEQTTDHGDFTLDGSRISNGHHNAIARVHCNGESWEDNPGSSVGFDWFGGNPTPVPPPPGYEVSISLTVAPTNVPPGTAVGITVQAACSNTTVRAIRVKADGNIFYELGSPVVTTQWSTSQVGDHTISAEAACNGDDSWKTSPGASVTITVQQNVQPSGGSSSSGTAGSQTSGKSGSTNPQPDTGSGATIPQAQQANTSGGFDLIKVAYAWGYGNVHNDNGRWDGWIMDGNGKEPRRLTMNDFNVICGQVYGKEFSAVRINDGAGGIRCGMPPECGNDCGGNQPPQPSNNCPPAPSRLNAGDIAIVSDADPYPLLVWDNPGNPKAPTSFTIPIREQVSIIETPFCLDGRVWVKIGYNGRLGFAVEVTLKNTYNLIPNGQPMLGDNDNDSGNNPGPTPTPSYVWYYPVATGMGSPSGDWYAYVPGNLHSLFCRTNPQSVDRSNVKATFRPNDYFTVVEARDGWVRVQSSLGDCWVSTQYAKVTDKRQQTQPTQAPVQTSNKYTAPYNAVCPSNESNSDLSWGYHLIATGWYNASGQCNPQNGEMVLFLAVVGGKEGNTKSSNPTQQGVAISEMVFQFTPNFNGTLQISTETELWGNMTAAASPLSAFLPDNVGDEIAKTLVGKLPIADKIQELIENIKNGKDIVDGSKSTVSARTFIAVDGASSSSQLLAARELSATFPGSPFDKFYFDGSYTVATNHRLTVRAGVPIIIHVGMTARAEVYGSAIGFWLPIGSIAHPKGSVLKSIVLTRLG